MLFARALLAFLILPGAVAYVVPLLLAPSDGLHALRWPGILIVGIGTIALLWCVRDFYAAGKGTLAPWAPPRRLVVIGLYRWSRNPMYVAVLTVVSGWAFAFASWALGLYAMGLAAAFHLRVVYYEEPRLAALFPAEWIVYRASVPRWLGSGRTRAPVVS